jgi:hypothetical protein
MSCVEIGMQRSLPLGQSLLRITLSLLVFLTATPALAQTVSVESDESVDFTKFKSFAIREGRLTSRSPALNSDLTKKRIAAEIEAALTAKGLSVATGQADLNVSFELGSSRILETKTYPAGWRGHGTRVVNVPQSSGTMVIDLNDAITNSLVWRSITVESEPNPVKLADKLDKLVKKAIGKYPKLKAAKK